MNKKRNLYKKVHRIPGLQTFFVFYSRLKTCLQLRHDWCGNTYFEGVRVLITVCCMLLTITSLFCTCISTIVNTSWGKTVFIFLLHRLRRDINKKNSFASCLKRQSQRMLSITRHLVSSGNKQKAFGFYPTKHKAGILRTAECRKEPWGLLSHVTCSKANCLGQPARAVRQCTAGEMRSSVWKETSVLLGCLSLQLALTVITQNTFLTMTQE